MSRTDKDAPWWVQSIWFEPDHNVTCVHYLAYGYRAPAKSPRRPCDLPKEPVVNKAHTSFYQRKSRATGCCWIPCWPRELFSRYRYTRRPPGIMFHLNWWGPLRAQERDILNRARKHYRGTGDAGDPELIGMHRHAPISGGWWD